MQLPEAPPPLAPLWDRILRARTLPPDLDVQLLYTAIRDRLTHPEWEVRLHALRVLADLLPLSNNALSFPFDQVIDNLGYSSPNVRKAALDALKVFCTYCEEPECAARAILDKCSYKNIRPHSADLNFKINVVTGLILSIPSLVGILKRRCRDLDLYPIFVDLGEKLFDSVYKDAALRSLMKLRRVCGPRDYMLLFSRLDTRIQDKFRYLCEVYDEDSMDVYYAPRKPRNQHFMQINRVINNTTAIPLNFSTDSSSESDTYRVPLYNNNYAKVIIETEIKFDSDTAITMTVLEQNETESDRNLASDEDCDSDDRRCLKYSEMDSEEDSDVVVKKVRFGGESVKIRTPDSDNIINSEDDINQNTRTEFFEKSDILKQPSIVNRAKELKEEHIEKERNGHRKSGIPLPVINKGNGINYNRNNKLKSKSLSELYDYFKYGKQAKLKERTSFALTLTDVRSPDKVPSPVEIHREIEVLHNLQRSPTLSPRRQQTRLSVEKNGFVLNLIATSPPESLMVSPRAPSPLKIQYDWENLGIVPRHVADQLHNTDNWIAAVKAADQLHRTLLESDNVMRVEPAASSLVNHMWALSDAIPATRAPTEGVVCAIVRNSSTDCIRQLLPSLLERTTRDPPPNALPHALLQRIALHHLVELIFDPKVVKLPEEETEEARLRSVLCLARAAGPAAVMSAVRRCLDDSPHADLFCNKLRDRLNRPVENIRPTPSSFTKLSQLPVPTRRRARSTPPAPAPRPRRLRPLPDSAPLPGITSPGRAFDVKTMNIPSERDSSANTNSVEKVEIATPIKEENTIVETATEPAENQTQNVDTISQTPSTPSVQVEDYSEKSIQSDPAHSVKSLDNNDSIQSESEKQIEEKVSQESNAKSEDISTRPISEKSAGSERPKSYHSNESIRSIYDDDEPKTVIERDVRTALAEAILPPRHEDWEAIVSALVEIERLAEDVTARAPAASWRSVVRSASAHVRSLRSRVARAACATLGTLFEHRGKILEPEVEEAASALLERCADANRFLRAEAANSLGRVACGAGCARAGVALARRGATHRAGPVRAAAAQALARLARHAGAVKILELPSEPRIVILRAAGELLGDAHPETRLHARHLCVTLAEDSRFNQLLKDSMPPTRYRAIEKYVEKLRCR